MVLSFVSLAPRHAQVFLGTNDPAVHFKECHAEEEDLRDIQLDLADQLVCAMDEHVPSLTQRLVTLRTRTKLRRPRRCCVERLRFSVQTRHSHRRSQSPLAPLLVVLHSSQRVQTQALLMLSAP